MTSLTKSVREILKDISQLNFYRNASLSSFDSYSKSQKGKLIKAIEQVYFSSNLFSSIFESLNHALSTLESAKRWRDKMDKTKPVNFSLLNKRSIEITQAWWNIYSILHKLVLYFTGNKLVDDDALKMDFPEIYYCRLLRNDFMQHPDLPFAFDKFGKSIIYPASPDLLPYEQISPRGDGFLIYLSYFQSKVSSTRFLSLSDSEKGEKNKIDYIKQGGWKQTKKKKKNSLRNRIKGFGLPPIDQQALAKELEVLFKNTISPYLVKKKRQGERWGLM